jgi:hypothetical protein
VRSITVSDTAANVLSNITNLGSNAKIATGAITVTDTGSLPYTLGYATYSTDKTGLDKIAGTNNVIVTGVLAANAAAVTADAEVRSITVSDTIQNILANELSLNANLAINHITATNQATVANIQSLLTNGMTSSQLGHVSYDLLDTANALASGSSLTLNDAHNISVSDTALLSQAVTLFAIHNSGVTTYAVEDGVTSLQSALGSANSIAALKHATSVTADASLTMTQIDMSGFSGANTLDLTINGNILNDSISGGAGNDIINSGDGNDFVSGGAGNDTINLGLGTDTLIFSTTQALNGVDTVNNFSVYDSILFNFSSGLGSELTKSSLHGGGANAQILAEGGALGANTGLVVISDVETSLTTTQAQSVANGLSGISSGDKLYMVMDNGTNAEIFLISGPAHTAQLISTLNGVTTANLTALEHSFTQFHAVL